jgi:hypothetical protein
MVELFDSTVLIFDNIDVISWTTVLFFCTIDIYPGRKLRAGSCRKAREIDWNPPEKIQQISGRNTASTSACFRCFPAGSGDFPAFFLQDPVGSNGRNLRHG